MCLYNDGRASTTHDEEGHGGTLNTHRLDRGRATRQRHGLSLSLQPAGRWRCKLSAGRFLSPGGYCLVATPAICGERGIITACLRNTGRHTHLGWKSMSAIRPRQRACDTASGSGECARTRAPIVSGWRSSAAPAFRAFGGWRARVEGIWVVARAAPRFMEPQPIDTVRIDHQRRLHQSSVGGDAACERFVFSRERIGRRRASEAGARASTPREAYHSTRLVGAGRTGPSRSASNAVGEQPGLESGGLHRVPPARLFSLRL